MSARQWFYWSGTSGSGIVHQALSMFALEMIGGCRRTADWSRWAERDVRGAEICKRCDRARQKLEAES